MARKKRGRKKQKNDNLKLLQFFAAAVIILVAAIYYISRDSQLIERKVPAKDESALRELSRETATEVRQKPASHAVETKTEAPGTPEIPRLSIIIDDIGFTDRYKDIIAIDVPITLAIIPFTPHAIESAEEGQSAGAEIILHLPMEPIDYPATNPGTYALLTGMTEREILDKLRKNLETLPHIKGVNNHMGSRFTEDNAGMKIVLTEIKKRGLYFIDSRTSYRSVGFSLARSMDIRTAERSVFLDNVQTEAAIEKQLMEAVEIARKKGESLAIGHPHASTVAVLARVAPSLAKEGIKLVYASQMAR